MQVWSRHPCLASKAKLNAFRSLNPIPPHSFGVHIFSQLSQAILSTPLFCPHQNFRTIPASSSHSESSNLKQLMVYEGIAWATDFIKISFPAFDKSFSFHQESFFPSLSFRSLKVFFLDLPTRDGRPKYFSC